MARRDVERTEDGRHIVVDGRRWRASDPAIPATLRAELVSELMSARRAVGAADDEQQERAARGRVHDAKVALGERGQAWWEPPEHEALRERLTATLLTLLRRRDPSSSICPSDMARVAGGDDWREVMPVAREVAAMQAGADVVRITSGDDQVPRPSETATWNGPIRIRRGPAFPTG